jgi:hypothetical protein
MAPLTVFIESVPRWVNAACPSHAIASLALDVLVLGDVDAIQAVGGIVLALTAVYVAFH